MGLIEEANEHTGLLGKKKKGRGFHISDHMDDHLSC